MWSNIGAAQQRGHLGLAAPSSPPPECMTITNTTAQHSLQRFTVSRALSVGLLASVRRTRRHWQFFLFQSSLANTNQAAPDPTHGHWVLQQP